MEHLLSENHQLSFQAELQGRQLMEIEARLSEIGNIKNSDALALIDDDGEEFRKYLYYTSAKTIKRLGEPKSREVLDIVLMDRENPDRVSRFSKYLNKDENVDAFLYIFSSHWDCRMILGKRPTTGSRTTGSSSTWPPPGRRTGSSFWEAIII